MPHYRVVLAPDDFPLWESFQTAAVIPTVYHGQYDKSGQTISLDEFRTWYDNNGKAYPVFAVELAPRAPGYGGAKWSSSKVEQQMAEFGKIVGFLKSEGWTFMLPREYAAKFNR